MKGAKTVLIIYASNRVIGAALHQDKFENSEMQPLAFFPRKLSETEMGYNTYNRKLFSIFEARRHFHNQLEGWDFTVYTDPPLSFAFTKKNEKAPCRPGQLDYISQFTTDIRHVT